MGLASPTSTHRLRDTRCSDLGSLYGVIPAFQSANFGRVYAAYGGVFVVMSIAWGWLIDKRSPDFYDLFGGAIVVLEVAVIMYWPRAKAI